MQVTVGTILGIIALVCGILMLVGGTWSRYPLAGIAIISLALLVVLPAFGVRI
jgi:hypothetical protein